MCPEMVKFDNNLHNSIVQPEKNQFEIIYDLCVFNKKLKKKKKKI